MKQTATKKWSRVIDAVLLRDPQEGTYEMTIHLADKTLMTTMDIDAVTERAAMLEATDRLQDIGYSPVGRWTDEDNEVWGQVVTRKFKRTAV